MNEKYTLEQLDKSVSDLFDAEEVIYIPAIGYLRVPPGMMTDRYEDYVEE